MSINESSTTIFWTDDYGVFSFLHGNRDIDQNKVKRICKANNDGINLFKVCPILVTRQYKIIDGQNRYVACKKLKQPIYFCYVDNFTHYQIARMNQNNSAWRIKDFMNCYVDLGVESYVRLKQFIDEYHISISAAIRLLEVGHFGAGGGVMEHFKEGSFEIKQWNHAIHFAKMYLEYYDLSEFCKSRHFQLAIMTLQKSGNYDHDKVIAKLRKTKAVIEEKSSTKEYISQLDTLYNKGNQKHRPIW
jgi:hypothetical protein